MEAMTAYMVQPWVLITSDFISVILEMLWTSLKVESCHVSLVSLKLTNISYDRLIADSLPRNTVLQRDRSKLQSQLVRVPLLKQKDCTAN